MFCSIYPQNFAHVFSVFCSIYPQNLAHVFSVLWPESSSGWFERRALGGIGLGRGIWRIRFPEPEPYGGTV